jgi:hypothetical protein
MCQHACWDFMFGTACAFVGGLLKDWVRGGGLFSYCMLDITVVSPVTPNVVGTMPVCYGVSLNPQPCTV